MYRKYHKIFEKSHLSEGLTVEEFESLLKHLKPVIRTYKKNEVIFSPNEKINGFCFILSGEIIYSQFTGKGERKLMGYQSEGSLVGFVQTLLPSHFYFLTYTAATDCTVMFFLENIEKKLEENPDAIGVRFLNNLLKHTAVICYEMALSLKMHKIRSLRERLAYYLLDQLKEDKNYFYDNFNREELSDYLGVHRPNISRELSKLKQEGIIDYYRSTIKILDIEKLKEIAYYGASI